MQFFFPTFHINEVHVSLPMQPPPGGYGPFPWSHTSSNPSSWAPPGAGTGSFSTGLFCRGAGRAFASSGCASSFTVPLSSVPCTVPSLSVPALGVSAQLEGGSRCTGLGNGAGSYCVEETHVLSQTRDYRLQNAATDSSGAVVQHDEAAGALGNHTPDSGDNVVAGIDSCRMTDRQSSPILVSVSRVEQQVETVGTQSIPVCQQDETANALGQHVSCPASPVQNEVEDTEERDSCETTDTQSSPILVSVSRVEQQVETAGTQSLPVHPGLAGRHNGATTENSCSRRPSHSLLLQRQRTYHAFQVPLARAAAISASNLMRLLSDAMYCAEANAKLCAGVPRNKRDAMDNAGKVVSAVKSLAIGLTELEIAYDPSQAGGLLGKFDAMFVDGSGIEIKASRSYRGNRSFQFARLRPDSPFQVRMHGCCVSVVCVCV